MQPFGPNDRQARVRVAKHQHGIRLCLNHEFVRGVDDIAHRRSQVVAHGIHVDFGIGEFEIPEEDTVEVVVVVLPRMCQNAIEILPAFVDHRRQADNLGPRAYDYQQFEFAVVLEPHAGIVQFNIHLILDLRISDRPSLSGGRSRSCDRSL